MESRRQHLTADDLEVGYADVGNKGLRRHAATHKAPPMWLQNWEDRRPRILSECFGEMLGVYIYTLCGVGATAAFFVTTVGKLADYGSLLTIGLAYGIGITLAIIIAGPASGGHLSPCFTLAFWLFKGFPTRKVPFYILAQILGGFLGILSVYGMYHQQLTGIYAEFSAVPELAATIYTPVGPAGVLALFTNPGQDLRYVFVNEFIANLILSITVFSVLDASNIFMTFSAAPFTIAIGYMVMIWSFAPEGVALNTARDLGGRMACAVAFDASSCFPTKYTALACLTNILATQIGAAIQILLLSDSARPVVTLQPNPDGPSLRTITRDEANGGGSMRVVSRDNTLMEKPNQR